METDKTLKDYLDETKQFVQVADFLESEEVRTALGWVQKVIDKPDVPATRLPMLVNQLQALGAKFAVLAKFYQTIGKSGKAESDAKNLYYTLSEEMDKLVMALKRGMGTSVTNL